MCVLAGVQLYVGVHACLLSNSVHVFGLSRINVSVQIARQYQSVLNILHSTAQYSKIYPKQYRSLTNPDLIHVPQTSISYLHCAVWSTIPHDYGQPSRRFPDQHHIRRSSEGSLRLRHLCPHGKAAGSSTTRPHHQDMSSIPRT